MDPEIQSILDKDSLESIFANIKFLDTQNGTRNNTLTDPLKTVEAGLEDMAVPEGMELKTIGVGPNQRQVLIQKDRPKGFWRPIAGAWDVLSGFDTDRQGGTRFNWGAEDDRTGYGAEWNEETKQKILEREGKADLSGNALPSKAELRKRLELNALEKQAQRIELAKDAELNNALVAKQIETNTEALYPYLLRAQLDAQMSPYGQTIIRGRTGDLSASMKDATTRQLYAATQAAQAGLARPAGIRYANTA
tara:strand:- start:991 stop:1740 length:750 start_codon:yes stop_codon:yes gene_type:complete